MDNKQKTNMYTVSLNHNRHCIFPESISETSLDLGNLLLSVCVCCHRASLSYNITDATNFSSKNVPTSALLQQVSLQTEYCCHPSPNGRCK